MQKWVAWGLLGILSVQDFRTKELSFPWLLGGFLLGGISFIWRNGWDSLAAAECLLTGAIILLFSRVSNGAVGSGDGWVLMDAGWFLGGREAFSLLILGLLLSSLWAVILFFCGKAGRKKRLAFVPFLWAAETGILFLQ
jgi:prepilin signal peptidase PulO-like enzyme (type II secretory pathway)